MTEDEFYFWSQAAWVVGVVLFVCWLGRYRPKVKKGKR